MFKDSVWKTHGLDQVRVVLLWIDNAHDQRNQLKIGQYILEVQIHLDDEPVAWLWSTIFARFIELQYSRGIDISNGITIFRIQLTMMVMICCCSCFCQWQVFQLLLLQLSSSSSAPRQIGHQILQDRLHECRRPKGRTRSRCHRHIKIQTKGSENHILLTIDRQSIADIKTILWIGWIKQLWNLGRIVRGCTGRNAGGRFRGCRRTGTGHCRN
mmetsp:Transcript_46302/g.112223  ORF Transcript_46302/g.112223 Transcript_46302/m.112223 type:complete len:213 (+) Transcript_46302:888-1526(+)